MPCSHSKVTRALCSHPNACTDKRYEEVFKSLATTKNKKVLNTRVPTEVLNRVSERLHILCRANLVPPLVRWHAARPQHAECRVMPPLVFDEGPAPLIHRQSSKTYEDVLKQCLRTLIAGGPLSTEQRLLLDDHFPRRRERDRADVEADMLFVHGEVSVQETRRVRQRRTR